MNKISIYITFFFIANSLLIFISHKNKFSELDNSKSENNLQQQTHDICMNKITVTLQEPKKQLKAIIKASEGFYIKNPATLTCNDIQCTLTNNTALTYTINSPNGILDIKEKKISFPKEVFVFNESNELIISGYNTIFSTKEKIFYFQDKIYLHIKNTTIEGKSGSFNLSLKKITFNDTVSSIFELHDNQPQL